MATGTMVSMAKPLVGSAISMAASAAANEMSLLMGVRNEIWFIKDELKTMQAFLRAAEVTREKDELVNVWAEQVRDLAYDIEDCLEEFAVHVGHKSLLRQLMKLRHRHQIAVQIRSLKLRAEEVSNRNMRYNLLKSVPSPSIEESMSNIEMVRHQATHCVHEADLVGFVGPKKDVLEQILSSDSDQVQVIWIIGAGGLGKTTLAKKVYESSEISAKFTCRAWITVSQSFSVIELLKEMITQLLGTESLKQLLEQRTSQIINERLLADHLQNCLKDRRYFLVLDDLWTTQAWNCIKPTFCGGNEKGSRVIVTTRNGDLAGGSSSSLIYNLKPLAKKDATNLLLRKTSKSLDDIKRDKMSGTFDKIINKCGGLPLAIVTIGGLLATTDVSEWETLYSQLPSELERNPSLEAMRKVIAMSYNHLPSHLKPCFLYLSIFREDFEIRRRRLVDRWIAEGFVEDRVGMNIEDVANSYFDELISRSMIQPSRVNIQGAVKSCRVHDITRDIIVLVSRNEKFVFVAGDNNTHTTENFRHTSFFGSMRSKIGTDWSHVRSLTFFGERPLELWPSLCSTQLRMLRVLDLEDARFEGTQKDINNIMLMHHLKYLNVRVKKDYSNIYKLPRSIEKLHGLQALDTRRSHISNLPTEITKLEGLRSIRCSKAWANVMFDHTVPLKFVENTLCLPFMFTSVFDLEDRSKMVAELHSAYSSHFSNTRGVRVPRGISNLKALQILEVVDLKGTSTRAIEELGKLSELRKLSVTTDRASEKKCKTFCEAIQKLPSLHSLCIDAYGYNSRVGTLGWLGSAASLPPLLRSLKLTGCVAVMPDCFRNLTQLVKIQLRRSKLEEGKTIDVLGGLPKLMLLRLYPDAYDGKKLVFRQGAFLNLRELIIWSLGQLREIRFEEGASPQMESLEIGDCMLESGINGIKHLPKLKEISLSYGSKVARLGVLQEEGDTHPNQPVLRLKEDRSHHDLGDAEGREEFFEAVESLPEHDELPSHHADGR